MKAKLLTNISKNWPKGTEVVQYGQVFCKLEGGCLDAFSIYHDKDKYGDPLWRVTEDDTVSDISVGNN